MARVADHLSVEDLEARLRSAQDPTATRHFQVIWLLARGHTIAEVAAVTSFVPRWIEQLLARYNAHGPEALGDLRRRNGSAPSVLRAVRSGATEVERLCWEKKLGASRHRPWDAIDAIGDTDGGARLA